MQGFWPAGGLRLAGGLYWQKYDIPCANSGLTTRLPGIEVVPFGVQTAEAILARFLPKMRNDLYNFLATPRPRAWRREVSRLMAKHPCRDRAARIILGGAARILLLKS